MENPLLSNVTRTTICSVVFVDIVEYSKLTVSKQLAIKGWFNDLLSLALHNLSPTERIILDTGDGAALCFMGDPEDALFVANSLRVALTEQVYPGLELRIGINLGPVKIVKDINGRPNIIGDGINSAQRVMGFAAPNQILVSRSFYEVVSCLSEEYAQLFGQEAVHQDKHIKEHHVYEVRVSGLAKPTTLGTVASQPVTSPKPEVEAVQEVVTAEADFDAQVLATLSKGLSKRLGPIASLIVKKTAKKARDHQELVRMLADSIPIPHERSAFVQEVASHLPPSPEPAKPDKPQEASVGIKTTGLKDDRVEFSKDALARVEQMLTAHIGPVARILMNKAVKTAHNQDELLAALARSIDNERARSEFLAAAKKALGAH